MQFRGDCDVRHGTTVLRHPSQTFRTAWLKIEIGQLRQQVHLGVK